MADYKKLKPFILKFEGGFVNDPRDRGGATNKGITIATFRQFFGASATIDQLKNITDAQWDKVFTTGFWKPCAADFIKDQHVADIIVDWAWASGPVNAKKRVQQALALTPDGQFGQHTVTVLNTDSSAYIKILKARFDFIDANIKAYPGNAAFRKGWERRIAELAASAGIDSATIAKLKNNLIK